MTDEVYINKGAGVPPAGYEKLQTRAHELVEDTLMAAGKIIDLNGLAIYAGFTQWQDKALSGKYISLFKHTLAREILGMRVKAISSKKDKLLSLSGLSRRIGIKPSLSSEIPALARSLEMQAESAQSQKNHLLESIIGIKDEAIDPAVEQVGKAIIDRTCNAAGEFANLLAERGLVNKNGDIVPALFQVDGEAVGAWQQKCRLPMPPPLASKQA